MVLRRQNAAAAVADDGQNVCAVLRDCLLQRTRALLLQLPQQFLFVQAAFLLCIVFSILTSIMSGFRRILLQPRGNFPCFPRVLAFSACGWYDKAMKKRVAYYVSRKNPLIWLAALVMLASAALRIANVCGKGADAKTVWFLVVLPVVGCVFYVLNILCNGSDRFYRSSVPVILLAIYYGIKITLVSPYLWLTFMFWIAYLAIAAFYAVTVSGHIKSTIPLLLLLLAALGILVGMHEKEFTQENWPQLRQILPDMLFLLAGILTLLGAKVYLDGAYHPTWGDRPDGRRLRTLDPMAVVANYIMPTRGGSSNFIRESVEISAMERYIREKRKQGYTNLGVTHVFLAAYVQCVAKYPALNRFLSGQQVYSRDDDIQFCMVVKTSMDTSAPESITKLHLKPTDTIDDIYEKLNKGIASIQGQAIGGSDFDKTAKFLSFIPGVLFKFVVWLLKTIDYFGFLPKFLLEVSPFHASIFFTSMGSLGIPPIVHHLYDFGNMPVFVAFGCKYHKNEVLDDGTVVRRKYIDYTVNTDERICDGFYYATTLKHLKRLLSHPEQLDKPAPVVNHDIE